MFSEENFPAKGTAGTADIPNVERLESFGVLVEILPNSGHEMMISNPEDFTKILSGFLNTNWINLQNVTEKLLLLKKDI